jgi:hypothetical protein
MHSAAFGSDPDQRAGGERLPAHAAVAHPGAGARLGRLWRTALAGKPCAPRAGSTDWMAIDVRARDILTEPKASSDKLELTGGKAGERLGDHFLGFRAAIHAGTETNAIRLHFLLSVHRPRYRFDHVYRIPALERSAPGTSRCRDAQFLFLTQRLAASCTLHPIPQPSYSHVRHSVPITREISSVSFTYFRVSTASCLRPAAVIS